MEAALDFSRDFCGIIFFYGLSAVILTIAAWMICFLCTGMYEEIKEQFFQ